MDESELKHRTRHFALRCIELAGSLPNNATGRAIASQLVRCGTSVGANCRSACRGRSRPEFVAKLGIVEEEADESGYWMELIMESGLKPPELVRPLYQEADELVRIIVASIRRARSSRAPIQNRQSKIQNLS